MYIGRLVLPREPGKLHAPRTQENSGIGETRTKRLQAWEPGSSTKKHAKYSALAVKRGGLRVSVGKSERVIRKE